MGENITPHRLMLNLALYFVLLFGGAIAVGLTSPKLLSLMPLGGTDAIEIAGIAFDEKSPTVLSELPAATQEFAIRKPPTARQIGLAGLFLAFSLGGTILVMLPIGWTYIATKKEIGYKKNFARALIVLPICAATIVLLIQNNLALAFGLAAMVAAVRYRVALREAIDGIYIFASICVGLAAGIGYLGIGAVMAVFFCFANAVMWNMEFGRNSIDDTQAAIRRAKLEGGLSKAGETQQPPHQ